MAAFIVRDKSANDSAHLLKLDVSGKRGTIIAGYCKTLNAFLSWTILLITGEFEYNQQQKRQKKRENSSIIWCTKSLQSQKLHTLKIQCSVLKHPVLNLRD